MSIVLPMVKESQTSGGTGNLTGCAAVPNYFRGDTAPGGALNRRYKYWILDGANYEWGIGYKSDASTFVREFVVGNSAGTLSPLFFSASAEIVSMELPSGLASGIPGWDEGSGNNLVPNKYMGERTTGARILTDNNYMWLYPAWYDCARPVTKMAVRVTAAGYAGALCKLGMYRADPLTSRPIGLPFLETANFLVDTTGFKSIPFSTGSPETECLGRPVWVAVGVKDANTAFEGYLPYGGGWSIHPNYMSLPRPAGRYMVTVPEFAFPDLDSASIYYRSGNHIHVALEV